MSNTDIPENAQTDKVLSYARMIVRVAFTYVKNTADAEDIMQEVLVTYFEKTPQFVSDEHMKAWLIRVTSNKAKNVLRSRGIRRYSELSDIPDETDETSRYVTEAVLSLDEKLRIPVHLYYYEGYGVEQIASVLGISAPAVSKRLARAREKLKSVL